MWSGQEGKRTALWNAAYFPWSLLSSCPAFGLFARRLSARYGLRRMISYVPRIFVTANDFL